MDTTEARREAKPIFFRRIGVDLTLCGGKAGFDGESTPVRGLTVSNLYGITFVVYPEGFIATKTSGLVQVALQAKDGKCGSQVQQGDYVDVQLPNVCILSLSRDELTLAACAGDKTVHLFDVPKLFGDEVDSRLLESRDIPEGHLKDFRWCPADDNSYLILSKEGQLFSGRVGDTPSRLVNSDVVAVSWSPDGKHVAYLTQGGAVCITNFRVELQHSFDLPSELGDFTENLHVEGVEWISLDAMLVSYTQTNDDGEDEECPLILVTSKERDFVKKDGTITAVLFDNTFPSIDSRVIPPASGPYMLAQCIKSWEMVIAANRRSVDDHIVTLGWSSENHEAISLELTNDTWLPRIELQENGDDNILLGLSVGTTTTVPQVPDPRDESGDTSLPACPVLMCLSLEGKLSLFTVARLDKLDLAKKLVSPPSELPKSNRSSGGSKSPADIALEATLPSTDIEIHASQLAGNKQVTEGTSDEHSVNSGSDANRENDGSYNGRFGKWSEAQKKRPTLKGESSLSLKETPSMPSLPTAGSSALISLASSGSSDISHLTSVKSAPSDFGQTQLSGSRNQTPSLPTKTVSDVQSASSQTSLPSHSNPFSSLPSSNLKNTQPFSQGLFGSVGNEKGTHQLTPSLQGTPSSSPSITNIRPSAQFIPTSQDPLASNLKASESSSIFGSAGNGKGANSQPFSSLSGTSSTYLSSSSSRVQPSSDFGFNNQLGNNRGNRAPSSIQNPSPFERDSQKGLQKTNSNGARTLSGSSVRQSGVSEPEQAFLVQLEQIRRMGGELDNLMAYIEGRGEKNSGNQPPCFTKKSLNELELEIRNLADNCKTAKERVESLRQSVNNLRDENLQVEAWRLYIQSKKDQAGDTRHQELWIRRKLTPDLDVKRKRVTKAEQALKQKIAALEEHVHHLELDSRKRVVSQKGGMNINRQTTTGRSQSVQNLYSTVNGLLASADRLSQQVAQQMDALHISAQPRTAQKIMESVGLPSDGTFHVQTRPTFSGTAPSPLARQQSFHSPAIKAELGLPIHTTPPRRTIPFDSGVGAPSITRRRRDSMDGVQKALALAGGASPKTTIERVSHRTPTHQLNSSKQFVRQRSSEESSEKISSHPRHVRRVLSSQTQSATSSSTPSTLSVPKSKVSSISVGLSGNSAVTNLEGSQTSSFLSEREPRDSRPDSKSAVLRNASSIAEKSVPTLTSRFGPPHGRTLSSPTSAVSISSNVSVGYSTGSLSSNASSESVFNFANSNPSNPAPSFSFATAPLFAKPTGNLDTSGSMPFGKQSNNTTSSTQSTTVSLPTSSSSAISSATSNATAGVSATSKLGSGLSKSGSDLHSKPATDSEKEDNPNFGFKLPSFGTPTFGTSPFTSSSFSGLPSSGWTQPSTSASSTSFTLSNPSNKVPVSRESDTAAKQNDSKQSLPLTPPAQPVFSQNHFSKAKDTLELSSGEAVAKSVPTPASALPSFPVTSASFAPQASISGTVSTNSSLSQLIGSHPPSTLIESASPTPNPTPSIKGSGVFGQTSTPTSSSQTPFVFPGGSTPTATFSVPPITSPDVSDEEDMDEEQGTEGVSQGGFNFGGLGLGSSSTTQSQSPKPSIFGNSVPFGTQQTSPGFGISSPQGQLFKPPSFSLPSAQSPPQTNVGFGFGQPTTSQTGSTPFGTAFGSTTSNPPSVNPFGTNPAGSAAAFGSPAPPAVGGFGQPSQLGPGQKALGSALGTFGQTRQMGFGSTTPFGSTLSAGFGSTPSGGLGSAATGGAFASAAMGGGFASAATGGGFASAATGGGFASAATGGGFASAATGGGFAGASGTSGGFAGLTGGGFQAFGGGGKPAFGSSNPPAPSLFTQMRK